MAHSVTRQRLDEFDDSAAFEKMCCALLVHEYGRLIPFGGTRDKGLDAVQRKAFKGTYQTNDMLVVFQFSLEKTWPRKLLREMEKLAKNGIKPNKYVFVSNQAPGSTPRLEAESKYQKQYGFEVEILDVLWLQARLESPDYLPLRRQYLILEESSLPVFLELDEYKSRRIDRLRAPDLPGFFGRDDDLEKIKTSLSSGKRVAIVIAPPGIGKTKLLLETFTRLDHDGAKKFLRPGAENLERHLDELDPKKPLLLFADDIQDIDDLRGLVQIMLTPELKTMAVLAVHPWAASNLEMELHHYGILCEQIHLKKLKDSDIDKFIQQDSVGIKEVSQRRAVIHIAEGNPLIAYEASLLLRETSSLAGLTRQQVISAHLNRTLAKAFAGQKDVEKEQLLLAVVSAVRGIDYGEYQKDLSAILGVSESEVDRIIEKLEQMQILKRSWRGYRVVPELLADNLIFSCFFADGHPFDFREKVLEPLLSKKGDKIFRSLAQAESDGAKSAGQIIDAFIKEAIEIIAQSDASGRLSILTWLKAFSTFRPEDCLRIMRAMLEAEPAKTLTVTSNIWGAAEITNSHLLRECSKLAAGTAWHCEICMRETINLLYLIAAQQDHSRSNQEPLGDAIRVLTEQVIPLMPGKPIKISDLALDEISKWLSSSPTKAQLEIIFAALVTLLSARYSRTEMGTTDRSVNLKQGFLRLEQLKDLRKQVVQLMLNLYSKCPAELRVKIIRESSNVLEPVEVSGIPTETKTILIQDAYDLFSEMIKLSDHNALAERYEIWKALIRENRLGKRKNIEELITSLTSDKILLFQHLIEWHGNIHTPGQDWRQAEAEHTDFLKKYSESLNSGNLEEELSILNEIALQDEITNRNGNSSLTTNLGLIAKTIRQKQPSLLVVTIKLIEAKFQNLVKHARVFLGELYAANPLEATEIGERWVADKSLPFKYEACQSLRWLTPENFSERHVSQIRTLIALNDRIMDRIIIGWGGLIGFVNRKFHQEAILFVKTIASRRDVYALRGVAESIEIGGDFESISAEDLQEICSNFVVLADLDFNVEGALKRLFQVSPEGWLQFWEDRIKYEMSKPQGSRYFAAPFHLSADASYVGDSADARVILRKFLEWSSSSNFHYQHNGAKLFKLFSGRIDDIKAILEEWLDTKEIAKLRTVAHILHELGYDEFFLSMAKSLINLTDDPEVISSIEATFGSTGVVSGGISPVFQKRALDLAGWLGEPTISLRAKAFANGMIGRLRRDAELHSDDDWLSEE